MLKNIVLFFVLPLMTLLIACQESLEDKAERQAKDYTRKYCPTPIQNFMRTDSIVFNKSKRVYTYYVSFFDDIDNQEFIDEHRDDFIAVMQQSIRESTSMKTFLDAGFGFVYVCHSGKNPQTVLFSSGLK